MKICAFTQGKNVSSSRFRVRQYINELKNKGIVVDEIVSKYGAYPPESKINRPIWALNTLLERMFQVECSKNYDITLLQRTFISKFPTIEGITKGPRLLDIDDAIWVRNKSLSEKLGKKVDAVICGNEFIANEYSKYNSNIEIVPTGVDIKRFVPLKNNKLKENIIIGWSGSSSGLKYVYEIESSIKYILDKYDNVKLRIVSDRAPKFRFINSNKYEFIKWTPENEVSTIQTMDIGIMPLQDNIFERGKCSYKMLLYMACGIAVIVSEVGMNREVLSKGNIGYGANTKEEWIFTMENLIEQEQLRFDMGYNGRKVIVNNYSSHIVTNQLIDIFNKYK